VTRRGLLNAGLLVLVVALGIGVWLSPGSRDTRDRLTSIAPADARRIEIRFPSDSDKPTLDLERKPDGWHLVKPIARDARDGRLVTALAILGARTKSCYDTAGRDPAKFGLGQPRMELDVNGTTLAFGDRSADGRRYVRNGDRFCLVQDRAYPLLAEGLDGLASRALLRPGATPVRIETPAAAIERQDAASPWSFERGKGDAGRWADRWRGARAGSFELHPPDADRGTVRVRTSDGEERTWRIAGSSPDLVLVPAGAHYGMTVPAARGDNLIEPPPVAQEQPTTGSATTD